MDFQLTNVETFRKSRCLTVFAVVDSIANIKVIIIINLRQYKGGSRNFFQGGPKFLRKFFIQGMEKGAFPEIKSVFFQFQEGPTPIFASH